LKHEKLVHDTTLIPGHCYIQQFPKGKGGKANEASMQVQVKVERKEKNITVHGKPFINVLSRRKPHSFPKVSTAESGIYVLPELCSLQIVRKKVNLCKV
jgi:hypothetical protein